MPNPGLGAKVKNTLLGWVQEVFDQLGGTLEATFGRALGFFADLIEIPLYKMVRWEWKALTGEDKFPSNMEELLDRGEEEKEIAFLPILAAVAGALGMALIMAMAAAFMNKMIQEVNLRAPYALLAPDQVIMGIYRKILSPEDVEHHMGRAAYDKTTTEYLTKIMRPRNAPDEYIRMWLRDESMEGGIDDKLAELGFPEDEINILKTLAQYIPAVPDLVRMAVREAFTPEIVERYQLHADFPPEFAEWAKKVGVSEEWAKNYWASHWELPSITMAFEMLHRGIITDEDLDVLLRTLDVMPYWRGKITDVAYRPYSRVDVRRMYGVGVLDETAVKRSYLDLGYDDEKATNMTAFTLLFGKSAERDLTKAELLRGYREGILDESAVKQALLDMGYGEDEAAFYVALEDVKKADTLTKFKVDLAVTRYRAGEIDINELRGILGQLNLPAEQQDLIIEREQLKDTVKETLPTREDVTKWFRNELLDETDAKQYLSTMGYSDTLIDLYLTEQEKAPTAGTTLRWLVKGLIDEGTARSYLKETRYGDSEIDLLIQEATDLAPALEKLPPIKQVQTWYLAELISIGEAEGYLKQYGYGDKEIGLFIHEWTPTPEEIVPRPPTIKTIERWFLLDIVDEAAARSYLETIGFREPEIGYHVQAFKEEKGELGGE